MNVRCDVRMLAYASQWCRALQRVDDSHRCVLLTSTPMRLTSHVRSALARDSQCCESTFSIAFRCTLNHRATQRLRDATLRDSPHDGTSAHCMCGRAIASFLKGGVMYQRGVAIPRKTASSAPAKSASRFPPSLNAAACSIITKPCRNAVTVREATRACVAPTSVVSALITGATESWRHRRDSSLRVASGASIPTYRCPAGLLQVGCGRRLHPACSTAATAAMLRATSTVLVRQFTTLTRIARLPCHFVPLKNASPDALTCAITASVRRS